MLDFVYSAALSLLPLLAAGWLWKRLSRHRHIPRQLVLAVALGGAASAALAVYLEALVLGWTGLTFEVSRSGEGGALLAMFLLAAPLEEGLKVLVVWPLESSRRIVSPRLGVVYAVSAAAGFAAVESTARVFLDAGDELLALRILVATPAHLFFAGVWGYALGGGRGTRGRWFASAWLVAMLLHALYDHIVFGRGPGLWVVVAPLAFLMVAGAWVVLRDVAPQAAEAVDSSRFSLPPPSLRDMREALSRTGKPLMLHWIGIGALVTLGVMVACIALAVYLGHRIGIDFAMADEADVRSSGPLVLLGTAILVAFPIAGYLIARASAAESLLEPALAAGVAIAAIVLMLSVTAPVAIVFALAVAPVAFGLACAGAWFGLER